MVGLEVIPETPTRIRFFNSPEFISDRLILSYQIDCPSWFAADIALVNGVLFLSGSTCRYDLIKAIFSLYNLIIYELLKIKHQMLLIQNIF